MNKGFTLIELMIVIAIIAIIAAIAIPNLVTALSSSEDARAIANLRTMSSAEMMYRNKFKTYAAINTVAAAGFLDAATWNADPATKGSYTYTSSNVTTTTYTITATTTDTTGSAFRVSEDGVLYRCDTNDGTGNWSPE